MNEDLRQDGYNLTNHVINKDNLTGIISLILNKYESQNLNFITNFK